MSNINGRLTIHNGKWFESIFKSVFAFLFCFTSYVLLLTSTANAQEVVATLKADSNHILIGDFLTARLTVKFPEGTKVMMPPLADTVGRMELVKASKIDTSSSGNFQTYSQVYTVSAYDSGNFRLGPQKIFFSNKNGTIDTLLTDSALIHVATVSVDTTKAIKPIKAPLSVPYSWQEFIPYIIGGFALIAVVIALIYYLRKRKKRKPAILERPKPRDPPHIWARKELKKLDEEKLWHKGEVKQYYSRLTDILRLYLEFRYGWLALESTTEEISDEINQYDINKTAQEKLLSILTSADLVKFAKMLPSPDENVRAMDNAFSFIGITEQKEVKATT